MENIPHRATPEDPIEAQTGSALQRLGMALIAVAKRPSRAAYATWMRVIEPEWIVPLLGLTLAIGMLNGVITAVVETLLRKPGSHTVFYRFGALSLVDRLIYALTISPLFGLIVFALLVFFHRRTDACRAGKLE
jgi:hypothetical protein